MMKKHIRTPSGCFIRQSIDKWRYHLLAHSDTLPKPQAFDFGMDSPSISNQMPSYATKDFDIRRLHGKQIISFGAGSVGGFTNWSMAPAQVIIHLFDSKKVEPKHTQTDRTIYDSTQVGQLKVKAAQYKIESNFIGTRVIPRACDVAEVPDVELISLFKQAMIVILAIDDSSQILRINRLGYGLIEIVQIGIHRQGRSGHIAFSIPHKTPCLACMLNIASKQDIHRLDSEPASGVDIAIVSQHAARVAMELMYSKITGKPITRWDPTQNLIYVSNTKQDITPDGPGIHYESSQRRPDCRICQ
jgi:molybdopterin/thiamine biosynthesis adenylyltransferase